MKVLIIANVYPNKYGWSDGIFIAEQVRMLAQMGYTVDVLYLDLRSIRKKRKWGQEKYRDGNNDIYHYSLPCGPIPALHDLLYIAVQNLALKKYMRQVGKPDVIHGHFYMNGFWAKQIKEKYRIPYVLTEHSSELYNEKVSKGHRYLVTKAYNNVDCLISVSEALQRRMEKYTNRDIEVVPNVLLSPFRFQGKSDQNKQEFVFISVGHIVKSKGMKLLVECFEQVHKKLPQTQLVIVGKGTLRQELEDYAHEKKINVQFTGEVKHEEMPEIYRKCHCFVLPSERETFGVSYIEALACGLPVIATKCGGPEKFVNEQNGVLIGINDRVELTNAMISMYDNRGNYDSKRISEDILKKYGAESIGLRISDIYRECVAK